MDLHQGEPVLKWQWHFKCRLKLQKEAEEKISHQILSLTSDAQTEAAVPTMHLKLIQQNIYPRSKLFVFHFSSDPIDFLDSI